MTQTSSFVKAQSQMSNPQSSLLYLCFCLTIFSFFMMFQYSFFEFEKEHHMLRTSRRSMIEVNKGNDPMWIYITMPFISGFVGYLTNIVALKMTFYPLEFWGIPIKKFNEQPIGIIGWQGIIPCKAAKMARIAVKLMTERLINIQEHMKKLNPAMLSNVLEPGMLVMINGLTGFLAKDSLPAWKFIPKEVQYDFILKILEDSPPFITGLMSEIMQNVDRVLDIEHMVVEAFTKDKNLLNRVFFTCGSKELKFIERSGFYFGFVFGCIQTAVWLFYQGSWLLPVCGFIVGYLTNYLALKIIFRPIDPIKVCGFSIQGLFLKRQQQVAEVYAQIIASEVLFAAAFWRQILNGPLANNFQDLLEKHTHIFVDKMAGKLLPLVKKYSGGEEGLNNLKKDISTYILREMPKHIHHAHKYTEEALETEKTIRIAMQNITSAEFEGVIRPAFEEDELKLILVGAALGLAVGCFQYFVLFGIVG